MDAFAAPAAAAAEELPVGRVADGLPARIPGALFSVSGRLCGAVQDEVVGRGEAWGVDLGPDRMLLLGQPAEARAATARGPLAAVGHGAAMLAFLTSTHTTVDHGAVALRVARAIRAAAAAGVCRAGAAPRRDPSPNSA